MGFATRHLGKMQMTTDTAVLVAQKILEDGIEMKDLKFIDFPEIKIGKKAVVEMPFRYLVDGNGKPLLPDGLLEHLRAGNDQVLF